jgi:peptidoglycan hydrolase-like protein with peptidoglycan-binding domain
VPIDPVGRLTNNQTTPQAAPSAAPTLRQGSQGASVQELQQLLLARGHTLGADGKFGPRTQTAVMDFQRANGLNPDGVVGPRTWSALRGSTSAPGTDNFERPRIEPQTQTQTRTETQPRTETPARTVAPATTAVDGADDAAFQRARRLVQPGGSGTSEDADVVARSMQNLPPAVLDAIQRSGVQIVAARGSVTDHLTDLKGVRPRGWPPGATWDQVPGVYDPSRRMVVVATEDRNGRRVLSRQHGSFSLTLHEVGHGVSGRSALGRGTDSDSTAFREAYTADVPRLQEQNQTYLLQSGDAGPSEAYAESFARYFAGDSALQRDMPAMYAYWQGMAGRLPQR